MPILEPLRGSLISTAHELSSTMVGGWILNEGTGDKVFDVSGNGNHATITNVSSAAAWKAGERGNLVSLNEGAETDDHIHIPNSPELSGMAELTIATGVEVFNTTTWGRVVDKGVTRGAYQLYSYSNTGNIGGYINNVSGDINSGMAWSTGHQDVVMRYDGATLKFYKDGVLVSTTSGLSGSVDVDTRSLYVGGVGTGADYLGCRIHYLYIFNAALRESSIVQLHIDSSAPFRLKERPPMFIPAPPAGGGYPAAYYDAVHVQSNPGMM